MTSFDPGLTTRDSTPGTNHSLKYLAYLKHFATQVEKRYSSTNRTKSMKIEASWLRHNVCCDKFQEILDL